MSDRAVSLADVNNKLTKGADIKNDALLMMEPYNNWEEKIMPAPYAIAILGELIVISAMADFKLEPPIGGFKYVRWGGSFRASLAQVSGEGYKAFNMAHTAMDEIRNSTNMVPNFMKDAVSILVKGSDFDVKKTLPVVLQKIEEIATTCKERSENVAKKFEEVMNTILELQQSCVQTKSFSEAEQKKFQLEITQQKQRQAELEENKKRFKEQYDKINAQVEKYNKEYDKAIKEIPSGGDLLMYNLVDTVSNVISSAGSLLTQGALNFKSVFSNNSDSNGSASAGPKHQKRQKHSDPQTFEENNLFNIGCRLRKPIEDLSQFFNNKNELVKIRVASHLEQILETHLFTLRSILQEISSVHNNNSLKHEIKSICNKGISCYSEIESDDVEDINALRKKIQDVSAEVMQVDATCSTALNRSFLDNDPPLKRSENNSKSGQSTAQQAVKNAHFKIDAASERLAQVEKNFEAAQKIMLKNNEEMTKALNKIAEFNAAEATVKDVITVLRQGIMQLGKLQEQWSKLSQFFDQIAILIKTNLNTNMNKFISYTQNAKEARLEGYGMSQGMRDIIYKTTFEAVKYSFLVNHLSSGYHKVSNEYLMNSVSCLGNLLAIDNPEEITRAQLQLTSQCEDTVQAIKVMIQHHSKDFKRRITDRMSTIQTEFNAVLPPISEEDRQEVKQMIKKGIEKAPEKEVATGTEIDLSNFE